MQIAFAGPSLWVAVLFAVFALAFMYFKPAWSPTSLFHRTAHATAGGAHTRASRFTLWVTEDIGDGHGGGSGGPGPGGFTAAAATENGGGSGPTGGGTLHALGLPEPLDLDDTRRAAA